MRLILRQLTDHNDATHCLFAKANLYTHLDFGQE